MFLGRDLRRIGRCQYVADLSCDGRGRQAVAGFLRGVLVLPGECGGLWGGQCHKRLFVGYGDMGFGCEVER